MIAMIEAHDLSYRNAGRDILHPFDFSLRPGEFTVVVGPNGAGKSTLLKLLTGEIAPTAGTLSLDGSPMDTLSPAALARRRAVLPQVSHLVFPFTVAEIVALGLEAGGRRRDRQAIAGALTRADLAGFAGRLYGELSGGEQQRVHLARVLAQIGDPVAEGEARFLFLDEPVSSLDIRHQLDVLAIARAFANAGGGVMAVLHDLNLAALADRLLVLSSGRIVADGAPACVLTDSLIESVFGLELRVGALPPAAIPFVLPQTAAQP